MKSLLHFHDYVEKKIGKVTKYFDNVGEITVLLTVSKDRHIVEVTVPVQGILLRGQEATMDMLYIYRFSYRKKLNAKFVNIKLNWKDVSAKAA